MIRKILLALLALSFLVGTPALSQESPSARFTKYLSVMSKATSFSQVKPFFSATAFEEAYGPHTELSAEEQKEVLKSTSEMFAGWTVKSEKIEGTKATLFLASPKGETTEAILIQENGTWLLDG